MNVSSSPGKQDIQRHWANRAGRVIRKPIEALRHLARRITRRMRRGAFVAAEPNRSDAELTGSYVRFVESAVRDHRISDIAEFGYRIVLEHVSQQEGAAYLQLVNSEAPALLGRVENSRSMTSLATLCSTTARSA